MRAGNDVLDSQVHIVYCNATELILLQLHVLALLDTLYINYIWYAVLWPRLYVTVILKSKVIYIYICHAMFNMS